MKKKYKAKKGTKIFFLSILILIILSGFGFYAYKNDMLDKFFSNSATKIKKIINNEKKSLKIFDVNSDMRPYAVMIDNVAAARPQHGIQKAYLVYEIVVEGGLTRMLALFKDVEVPQIGPVRSSRHYFLDYAMENDAIYVHYGESPQALADIKALKINNLDGLANPANMFWRDSSLHSSPHNAYTNTTKIATAATSKKYRTESQNYMLFKYSVDSIELSKKYSEEAKTANEIKIGYSKNVYSNYTYDSTNKVYLKNANNKKHSDASDNEQIKVKNIIILTDIDNWTIDSEKGRQDIGNVGSGKGYYITNGNVIEIVWSKTSRSSKTIYKDSQGKELTINDGNTFIHLQPKNQTLTIN